MRPNGFREKISRFLQGKLSELREHEGERSPAYRGLALQYVRDPREDLDTGETNVKHYEAAVASTPGTALPPGLERLYRRTLVIEPTLACLAHCRYCLRSNYPLHTLTEDELTEVARYCGSPANRDVLDEVLITGGDPLTIPRRVEFLLRALEKHAPNVRLARIATRIPGQDPARIDDDVLRLFRDKPGLRFELATQVNHPVELFPETVDAFKRIADQGVRIYAQNVLLRGVNDHLPTLVALYDGLRKLQIEAHYLFHGIPMRGTHHLRTTLARGLELAGALTASGFISGRAKPMFAAMTDIGKITLYDGSVVARRDDGHVLLQSHYRLDERLAWNPTWQLPPNAGVDGQGRLRVWYLDGEPEAQEASRPC
jgi:lysine 2,3-aminomutase